MPATVDLAVSPDCSPAIRWLEQHGDALYAYARRRVRRAEIAEDLVQETLLAGIQAAGQFDERSQVRTWLIGILRHKIADVHRARSRQIKLNLPSVEEEALFTNRGKWKVAIGRWDGDPRQLVEQREFREVLDSCVSKMPDRMATLFLGRVSEEVPTAQLCEQLDITAENAWAMLHRARLRLRQCLTIHWFTEPANTASSRSE